MTINHMCQQARRTFYTDHTFDQSDPGPNENFTLPGDHETNKFLTEFLKIPIINELWTDVITKRREPTLIIGLSQKQCIKKGIDKGFTTITHQEHEQGQGRYTIYLNRSVSDVEKKIYLIIELVNLFNWEKYENLINAAKRGKLGKSRFAYLCEANEWKNLHLASDYILRLFPSLKNSNLAHLSRDFDLYYAVQKKSGHTQKYILQWCVLKAVRLFKRGLWCYGRQG